MKTIITPNKICNNCAPILIEFHHKQLDTEDELRRMVNIFNITKLFIAIHFFENRKIK